MQNETKNERISFKIKTSMKTKIVLDFFKINISLVQIIRGFTINNKTSENTVRIVIIFVYFESQAFHFFYFFPIFTFNSWMIKHAIITTGKENGFLDNVFYRAK